MEFSCPKWSKTVRCFITTLFKFALEYAIRKVLEKCEGLKFNGLHKYVAYVDNVSILEDKHRYYKKDNLYLVLLRRMVEK
jgi:hypothetical protein